jgi:hypothetical protein
LKEIKNIVTAANNDYIKYLLVMLKSLFENNRESYFHMYVLNNDIQSKEKNSLEQLCTQYGNKVFILEVDDYYYDQGVLNYLFWDKAKYIDTPKYNNRGYRGIANR